jgi:hypothetical protein
MASAAVCLTNATGARRLMGMLGATVANRL